MSIWRALLRVELDRFRRRPRVTTQERIDLIHRIEDWATAR